MKLFLRLFSVVTALFLTAFPSELYAQNKIFSLILKEGFPAKSAYPQTWNNLQRVTALPNMSPALLERNLRQRQRPRPMPPQRQLQSEIQRKVLPLLKHNFLPGKKTVDAIIFDADGTLLDSLWAWEHSADNFLRTQGIEPPADFNANVAKMSLMDGARLAKSQFNLPQSPEEILRLTLEPIRQRYYKEINPKAGAREILFFLHSQGIKLCIATASSREFTEVALKRAGIFDLFDFIITCDEVGVGKRNPAVYEQALQKLGTQKSRTLVVEDALYAVQTAKQAGFLTAAVKDEHSAKDQPMLQLLADYYIQSFSECRVGK